MVGLPILSFDWLLVKYLNLEPGFFKSFTVYAFLSILAIFVITATGSYFGKGVILSMLLHNFKTLEGEKDQHMGLLVLAIAVILLVV